jgi:uncharacterized protein YegP (UPF0339 family)
MSGLPKQLLNAPPKGGLSAARTLVQCAEINYKPESLGQRTEGRRMRFEIYRSTGTQPYRWRMRSGNSEIMASGEGYATKYNAERAVASIKAQISTAPVVDMT